MATLDQKYNYSGVARNHTHDERDSPKVGPENFALNAEPLYCALYDAGIVIPNAA